MRYAPLVEGLDGEGARAWDIHTAALEQARRDDGVIVLSVGDPDFPTPAPIVERAVDSLRRGRTRYTSIQGEPALREAIAAHHARLTGHAAPADSIVVTAGAQNGLFATALCLLSAGDEVIVPSPMYVTYEAVFAAAGARMVTVPLRAENGFHPDVEDIAAAATSRTRAIFMNSPHNPTGAVLTRDAWTAIGEICRRHDLWLISDEVYAGLTFDQPHISPCALPGLAERSVIVSSLSKSHAMTGWRLGWVVAPGALAKHLTNLLLCMLYGLPGFIQDAGIAALARESAELEAMRAAYRRRRDIVCARLNGIPGLSCVRPEGAMFVMADIRDTGLSAQDFAWGLLDRHKVSVLPGEAFGPEAAGHVRISLCQPEARLEEACARIADYVAGLPAEAAGVIRKAGSS